MFCVDTVIAKHFEMLFWDMDNKFLDESQGRNRFGNRFVIFMPGVMESYIITVIIINA